MKDKKLRELLGVVQDGSELIIPPVPYDQVGYLRVVGNGVIQDLIDRISHIEDKLRQGYKIEYLPMMKDVIKRVGDLDHKIEKMEGKKHGKTARTR